MIYTVRTPTTSVKVVTFRGALLELALSGHDAAIFNVFGKWIAGRIQSN